MIGYVLKKEKKSFCDGHMNYKKIRDKFSDCIAMYLSIIKKFFLVIVIMHWN